MGLSIVVEETTERKRAEEALRKTKDELEMRVQERIGRIDGIPPASSTLSSQLIQAQEKGTKADSRRAAR